MSVGLSDKKGGFHATKGGAQTLTLANTWYTIQYDAERFDNLGEYSTATYKFIPKRSGKYIVTISVQFGFGNLAAATYILHWTQFYDNTNAVALAAESFATELKGSFVYDMDNFSCVVDLVAGNEYLVRSYTNQASVPIINDEDTIFTAHYLGD